MNEINLRISNHSGLNIMLNVGIILLSGKLVYF
jgi:hypothetical protein